MTAPEELLLKGAQPHVRTEPAPIGAWAGAHRVSRCVRRNDVRQVWLERTLLFAAARRPPPSCRCRSCGTPLSALCISSLPRRFVFASSPVISEGRLSGGLEG